MTTFYCSECGTLLAKLLEEGSSTVFRLLCPRCDRDLFPVPPSQPGAGDQLVQTEIDGRPCFVAYMDAAGKLVDVSDATVAVVRFTDDGSESVFVISDPSLKSKGAVH